MHYRLLWLRVSWACRFFTDTKKGVRPLKYLEGELPSRQMKLMQAWIELHQDDLMADWHLASTGQTPFKIDPFR